MVGTAVFCPWRNRWNQRALLDLAVIFLFGTSSGEDLSEEQRRLEVEKSAGVVLLGLSVVDVISSSGHVNNIIGVVLNRRCCRRRRHQHQRHYCASFFQNFICMKRKK